MIDEFGNSSADAGAAAARNKPLQAQYHVSGAFGAREGGPCSCPCALRCDGAPVFRKSCAVAPGNGRPRTQRRVAINRRALAPRHEGRSLNQHPIFPGLTPDAYVGYVPFLELTRTGAGVDAGVATKPSR
jgi:hypothetical protein